VDDIGRILAMVMTFMLVTVRVAEVNSRVSITSELPAGSFSVPCGYWL
jgi:hypothetical protein